MKNTVKLLAVALVIAALLGCQKADPTPAPEAAIEQLGPGAGPAGNLVGVNGLALGTLELEGTEDAVTPAQAAELLPLWQIVQGGSLQGDAETQAVLKQIEGAMTESQLAAIETMELAFEDISAWIEEQGIEMPGRPEGQQSGPGALQNMTEEDRTQMREQFQNMTPEQRATRMAELGFQGPEGGAPGGGQGFGPGSRPNRGAAGRFNLLLDPLLELLTERAAQ